jgi:hypothetical protein
MSEKDRKFYAANREKCIAAIWNYIMKMKRGTKVEVIWEDSIAEAEGWKDAKDYDFKLTKQAGLMSSMGRLIETRLGYIYLAQSYRDPDGRFCSVIAIPTGCVKKIKRVK